MLRMVFVVVLAFAIWFGIQRFTAGEAAAESGGDASLVVAEGPTPGLDVGGEFVPVSTEGGGARSPLRIPELISVGVAGSPEHSEGREIHGNVQAFVVPQDAPIPDMLATLGENNRFLHQPDGRELVERLLLALEKESDVVAVAGLTRILELSMRGSIHLEDAAARKLVDRAYAQLQRPLRNTVFNPAETAGARTYQVKRGDSLDRIAARFRAQGILVEAWTLATLNRITEPRLIGVNQVIKIPVEPIRTVVEKGSFLMAVYVGDAMVRLYWVGHGKDGTTPETTFTVGEKQERPDWTFEGRVIPYGHPDNLLGEYWVGFKHDSYQGFGAHGTPEPQSIGTMASSGCIRLGDKDIHDYFRFIPRGTKVEIRSSR